MRLYQNFTLDSIPNHTYNFTTSKNQIPSSFDCILMYKDFYQNSSLVTDDTFMTNADTVELAIKDLDLSHKNPYTNKEFVQDKKNGINLYFQITGEVNAPSLINKTQITLDKNTAWHFVSGDIGNPDNWIPLTIWEESDTTAND